MASLFEAAQLGIEERPEDLHYRLTDPGRGTVVAEVSPVVVMEASPPPRGFAWLKRVLKEGTVGRLYRAARYHIPRVTLRVADPQNSTLFYIDRAEKLVDNPATPQCAIVEPSGNVLGYAVSDHYKALDPMDRPAGPDGVVTLSGRFYLRNRNQEVVGEVVQRVRWTMDSLRRDLAPGDHAVRIVAPDGTVWAWMRELGSPALEIDPRTPQWIRALLAAYVVMGKLDERLHMSVVLSGRRPPAPLDPTREPYPGFRHVHSSYMRYQEEVTRWFREEIKKRNRRVSAAT